MAQSIPLIRPVQGRMAEHAAARAASVPWYIWSLIVAVASGAFGGTWDISWHESIGRDTFWTPAHMMIYLCGVLGGLTAGYLILSTTFQKNSPLREASVSMWGFRGSLGAFLCAWGGVAMITSAPFDNWWHSAYGLDVKILSPPHTLLALGMTGIRFGALLMILAEMNRAQSEYRAKLERVLFFASLFLLGMTVGMAQELTHRFYMHGASFYLVVMITAPIWMAAIAWATNHRWAATLMTGMYTALHLAFCWLLPLVPAEPKLGPVYQRITHLVPPDFPLLLIVPAIVFDLLRRRTETWSRWAQGITLGTAFLASFLAVQWPFANFLMSPAAKNWIFVTNNYPYALPSNSAWVRSVFVPTEHTLAGFWITMALALLVGVLMTRVGIGWGGWMRRVRR
ncbi:MAG TPA: hypothetical protein VEU31_09505 [Candidatus Acidoferrales bacterium]|nr:hypothetical protein [Candidatus Acidoferrales bacterium]